MSQKRAYRLSDLIKRTLAQALLRGTNDARLHKITIVDVEMAANLSLAKVFYVLPDATVEKEVAKVLKKANGFFRTYLAQHADLRYTPKLKFIYDHTVLSAENLSQKMKDLD